MLLTEFERADGIDEKDSIGFPGMPMLEEEVSLLIDHYDKLMVSLRRNKRGGEGIYSISQGYDSVVV